MNQIFKTHKTLTFREADPAGIMFFGNIFGFAHDCFEEFIQDAGFTWKEWFKTPDYIIPIRHTDADFRSPFFPGEKYDVLVTVANFGQTSFKMKYSFQKNDKVHAVVHMVHSVLDAKTKQKLELPDKIKSRLEKYLESGTAHC